MEQTTMVSARSGGRSRAVAALAIVLLTAIGFVGGTTGSASAATCGHSAKGPWGRDDGVVTDVIVTVQPTSTGCATYLEVWGSCDARSSVVWQDACQWGTSRAQNNAATFWVGGKQVDLRIDKYGDLLYYSFMYPGFSSSAPLWRL